MRRRFACAVALLLAGCGEEPAPAPTPTPSATPDTRPLPPPADVPGALPAPELRDAKSVAGGWQARGGGIAYAGSDGAPLILIDCDRQRRKLIVTRAGVEGSRMRIVTDLAAATLMGGAGPTGIKAETNAADPFVRALSKAEGAIGVQVDDGEVLAVPANSAFRDTVAACAKPY